MQSAIVSQGAPKLHFHGDLEECMANGLVMGCET